MSDIALDPIGYSDALQKAGMPKAQADIIAKREQAALDRMVEARELATKKDLYIALAEQEARLTKTMFNMLLGFAGAIGAFFAIAAFFLKN